MPYWSLYLKNAGYAPVYIGGMFAILAGTKIIAPNVWGVLVDRHGRRTLMIRAGSALALLLFIGMPFAGSYLVLALLMAGYSFFANASLPQFEAVTFNHLGSREHDYGRIRLWGSVGFVVSVICLGALIDRVGVAPIPWWIIVCLAGVFLASLRIADPGGPRLPVGHAPGVWRVVRRPEVLGVLAVSFLVQFSHGPYYSFFSIYMQDYGYSDTAIGLLWSLGVMAEIGVFVYLPQLISALGLRRLLLIALALTTLRWCLLALFAAWPVIVVFEQILHLASFGLCHVAAISLIHRLFTGQLQGRGQALYSSIGFGAGGAAGALAGGLAWQSFGPTASFLMAAVAAAIGWVIAWIWIRGEAVGAASVGQPT